jgi:hypothetical protein
MQVRAALRGRPANGSRFGILGVLFRKLKVAIDSTAPMNMLTRFPAILRNLRAKRSKSSRIPIPRSPVGAVQESKLDVAIRLAHARTSCDSGDIRGSKL